MKLLLLLIVFRPLSHLGLSVTNSQSPAEQKLQKPTDDYPVAAEYLHSSSASPSFVIIPKIVGGYKVTINQVPFQVSVRRRSIHERQYGLGHVCGGTVISQRLVCSAAHCFAINSTDGPLRFRDPAMFVVVAGSSAIDHSDRYTQEYLVRRIIGHELYNATNLENDIALLFLDGYIPWNSPAVHALQLAIESPEEGTICLIHGWGKIGVSEKPTSLQQAPVPILRKELCKTIYRLPESQLCAGFMQGGMDACQGDSGGPLVCDGRLAGIISWGVGCADAGYPGVYTNISHLIHWIQAVNYSLDYNEYGSRGLHSISEFVESRVDLILGILAMFAIFN